MGKVGGDECLLIFRHFFCGYSSLPIFAGFFWEKKIIEKFLKKAFWQ